MDNLTGTSVIITGGSKGIGKSLAKYFCDSGAKVLICSRNGQEVEEACSQIDSTRKLCFGMVADVSKKEDAGKIVTYAISLFSSIDVLINNAGTIGEANLFENSDLTKWTSTISTNLLGTAYVTHAVLPFMKKSGKGKIINFAGAGVGGTNTLPHFSAYYASKTAVVGFTETVAREIEGDNIQMNCIAPGAINTSITDFIISEGQEKVGEDMYRKTIDQKLKGGDSIENVFDLLLYLVSKKSNHVTGKLLSAKWDSVEVLQKLSKHDDIFTLRRIDNELFYGSKK